VPGEALDLSKWTKNLLTCCLQYFTVQRSRLDHSKYISSSGKVRLSRYVDKNKNFAVCIRSVAKVISMLENSRNELDCDVGESG